MVKAITGIISGNSMYPALRMGWKVKAEPLDRNNVKIGNIVIFGADALTCHRIVGKIKFFNSTYFIHRGDNSYIGGIFAAKDQICRVVEVFNENNEKVNEAGWANSYFKRPGNLSWIYLMLYLVKRHIFLQRADRLAIYANRLCWRFLLRH